MKVAVYARVSTVEQTAENQLLELRRYVAPVAGPPSSTSTKASPGRRTAGPRSTSSYQTCGRIACKPSCAGVWIVSAGTFGTW